MSERTSARQDLLDCILAVEEEWTELSDPFRPQNPDLIRERLEAGEDILSIAAWILTIYDHQALYHFYLLAGGTSVARQMD